MNFSYENQGTYTYLVYKVGETDNIDTLSLGMLTNNKIPGLASTLFTQMDTEKYIKYNISAKVSVKQFFSGEVSKKRLIGVFEGIVDAMLSAEEYMLDSRSILLDTEYIFTDVSSCETVLVCLPFENYQESADLSAFFKNILFGTYFDQTENCDYVAKIMNYLNSTPVVSLTDFKQLLISIKGDASKSVAVQNAATAQAQPVAQPQVAVQQPVISAQPSVQQPAPQPAVNVSAPVVSKAPAQPQIKQPIVPPIAKSQSGMAIPQKQNSAPATAAPVNTSADDGKKMSMGYLLMHYNKENAELYKNQKANKSTPQAQQTLPTGAQAISGKPAMPIPPQGSSVPAKQQAPVVQTNAPNGEEKKITMGYLIQHYNKENADLYKAQKAAKKNGAAPAPAANAAAPAARPNAGFAVPGAPAQNPGFAVPGAPVQQPIPAQRPAAPVQQPVPQYSAPAAPVQQPVPQYSAPAAPVQQPVVPQYSAPVQVPSAGFGETTILGGGTSGETTVLSATPQAKQEITPYLIRSKNNEKIPVNKPVFRIGKEKSYVDYFVSDNTAISRSHANIITREGQFFVVDTNSTNHTYVDGQMISSNAETEIKHGTKIRLANEDFEFKLY